MEPPYHIVTNQEFVAAEQGEKGHKDKYIKSLATLEYEPIYIKVVSTIDHISILWARGSKTSYEKLALHTDSYDTIQHGTMLPI